MCYIYNSPDVLLLLPDVLCVVTTAVYIYSMWCVRTDLKHVVTPCIIYSGYHTTYHNNNTYNRSSRVTMIYVHPLSPVVVYKMRMLYVHACGTYIYMRDARVVSRDERAAA